MNGYCNYSSLDRPFKSTCLETSKPSNDSLLDLRPHLDLLPAP